MGASVSLSPMSSEGGCAKDCGEFKVTKRYSFFCHFNRPAMQQGKLVVWSVHFRGACYQASKLYINVPVESKYVKDGRQPRATFRGKAALLQVKPSKYPDPLGGVITLS